MSLKFTREAFIAQLLTYEGSPYQHQGRKKGIAIDCIGLITCPLSDLGADMSYIPKTYSSRPSKNLLISHLAKSSDIYPIDTEAMQFGDILVFTLGLQLSHFAIYLENNQMIHAFYKQSVIVTDFAAWENSLNSVWRLKFSGESL